MSYIELNKYIFKLWHNITTTNLLNHVILFNNLTLTIKYMKFLLIFIAILFAGFSTTSCRETKTETKEVVREVRVETENTEKDAEGILERAAKEVDKEVNDEIDKNIEKIGDDN